jgi:hypothetical protein
MHLPIELLLNIELFVKIPSYTNKMKEDAKLKTTNLEVAWCVVQMMKVSNLHHFSSKSYFRV